MTEEMVELKEFRALRHEVTVEEDGSIRLSAPELPVGTKIEVIVLIAAATTRLAEDRP